MKTVREILTEELGKLRETVRRKMVDGGVNASGRSSASMEVTADDDSGALTGLKSFLYIERGRGPGRVPQGFRGIIRQWILDKGIDYMGYVPKGRRAESMDGEARLQSLSAAIAFTIMKKGTVLHRFQYVRDVYTEAVDEMAENTAGRIIDLYSEIIQQQHINFRDK